MRYRRSVYRKKRIRMIITSLCISLAVVALILLVVGNVLGNKVEERHESDTDTEATDDQPERRTVKYVEAAGVALNEDGSMLSSRLATVARSHEDVCFYLDRADGALLYVSSLATKLGKQVNGAADMRTAGSIAGLVRDRGLYSIGIMHAPDIADSDDLARSAASGYYAARAAEVLRSGINDVLVYVGEPDADDMDDIYEELILMAEQIHRLSEDGVVGLSLPVSVLTDADNAALIERLWGSFDYLAADLTASDGDQAVTAQSVGDDLGGMLYYLLRYDIRVLIPTPADSAEAEAILTAAKQSGAKSIVSMPKA